MKGQVENSWPNRTELRFIAAKENGPDESGPVVEWVGNYFVKRRRMAPNAPKAPVASSARVPGSGVVVPL